MSVFTVRMAHIKSNFLLVLRLCEATTDEHYTLVIRRQQASDWLPNRKCLAWHYKQCILTGFRRYNVSVPGFGEQQSRQYNIERAEPIVH